MIQLANTEVVGWEEDEDVVGCEVEEVLVVEVVGCEVEEVVLIVKEVDEVSVVEVSGSRVNVSGWEVISGCSWNPIE